MALAWQISLATSSDATQLSTRVEGSICVGLADLAYHVIGHVTLRHTRARNALAWDILLATA